jgi:hypothetical protein
VKQSDQPLRESHFLCVTMVEINESGFLQFQMQTIQ